MKENEMVFGIRAVIEAIQADKEVDKILVKRDLQGDLSKELFEVLRGREIPVQRVPAERLDRLTRKNHQGVIAFMSAVTYQSLEDIIPLCMSKEKILSSYCWMGLRTCVISALLPVPASVRESIRS